MPAKRSNASATVSRSGLGNGIGVRPRKVHCFAPAASAACARMAAQSAISTVVGFVRPVPFEQRELGMMQGPALAVAEHPREFEDAALACGEQLLAGEFRRGVEIEPRTRAGRRHELGREGMQMGLVAGRGLENGGLDLDEVLGREKLPQRLLDAATGREQRPPVGMDGAVPPGCRLWFAHFSKDRWPNLGITRGAPYCGNRWRMRKGSVWCGPPGRAGCPAIHRSRNHSREGHRQLASQGQYRRDRRQALRHPDCGEHPSRQGHAGDPGRHAPPQRRGEIVVALEDDRAG